MSQEEHIDSERSDGKPTLYLIFAIFMLSVLNMQDGFDILAISYAAHAISQDWGISRSELGIVFSAGLFGMMIGAMGLSPLADKYGRKAITIAGLCMSGSGMLIAMWAQGLNALVLGRILTGIGVGGILASVNTLVSEYSGKKYRVAAISFFQLGFPFGAFLSGFLAAYFLEIGTWRHVFAFGAFTSFAFIPLILILPESNDFLAKRGGNGALEKINKSRRRFGYAPLSTLPDVKEGKALSLIGSMQSLLSAKYRHRTLLIWSAFFLLLTILYFLLSWMPKMIIDMGFSESQGNRGGRLINLTGMIGIIIIGIIGYKIKPSAITSFYLACLAVLLIVFSGVGLKLTSILIMVALIGICVHGSMIGLYSTVPNLYPTDLRATGTGWAIGISRFGAVLGPAMAGMLFDAGWTPQGIFKLFAAPALIASLIAFGLWRVEKQLSFSS